MKLKFEEDTEISFIINNSPLTKYHTLICPDVEKSLPQRITLNAIRFSVDFLLSLERNRYFRIGYNSPGALASVNHLHLHLMFIEQELYIDRVVSFVSRDLEFLFKKFYVFHFPSWDKIINLKHICKKKFTLLNVINFFMTFR